MATHQELRAARDADDERRAPLVQRIGDMHYRKGLRGNELRRAMIADGVSTGESFGYTPPADPPATEEPAGDPAPTPRAAPSTRPASSSRRGRGARGGSAAGARVGKSVGQAVTFPFSGGRGDGSGLVLAVLLWPFLLTIAKHGWEGVPMLLRAKFLNETGGKNGGRNNDGTTPSSTQGKSGGSGGNSTVRPGRGAGSPLPPYNPKYPNAPHKSPGAGTDV